MARIRQIGAFALLLGLLTVVGCGGGESQPTSTTEGITKDQWVKKAFALCERLSHHQQYGQYAFERAHGMKVGEPGQRELEQFNAVYVMPYVKRKIKELRALPVPEGEQGKIEEILKAMEEGIRESKAHPAWLAAPSKAHPIPFTKATELATAYGIWDCGQA